MAKLDWLSFFFDLSLVLILLLHGSYFFSELPFKAWLARHFYFLFGLHLFINGFHLIANGRIISTLNYFLTTTGQVRYWNAIFSVENLIYFIYRLQRREIAIVDTLLVSLSSLILILGRSVKSQ